jgi:mono/diheme cytochrome c family protein
MKIFFKIVFVLAFVLTSTVFLYSNYAHTATPSAAAGETGTLVSPRSLYVSNCARCHGSDGRAQTRLGRKLEADDLTTSHVKGMDRARVIRMITNGKGDMPSFKRKLTAAQISSIAEYIRSL